MPPRKQFERRINVRLAQADYEKLIDIQTAVFATTAAEAIRMIVREAHHAKSRQIRASKRLRDERQISMFEPARKNKR